MALQVPFGTCWFCRKPCQDGREGEHYVRLRFTTPTLAHVWCYRHWGAQQKEN